MRKRLGAWITVFGVLCLQVAALAADYVDKQTQVAFPDKLGEFERYSVDEFKDPRLGVAVRYRLSGLAKADVIVYDLGQKGIGAGIETAPVKAQFEQMKSDVFMLGERGAYKAVKLLSQGQDVLKTPAGDLKLLQAQFTYSEVSPDSEVPVHSYANMTGYKSKFFKVRFTHLARQDEKGKAARAQFLTDLGKLLK